MAVKSKTTNSRTSKKSVTSNEESAVTPRTVRLRIVTSRPRLILALAIILIAGIALGYIFRGLFVAAVVNGQPISRLSVISQLEKQGGQSALDNLITQKLIEQESQKRGIIVSQDQINSQLTEIEKNVTSQGTTLDAALLAQNMTRDQLTDQIKLQLMLQKLTESNVKVTEKEIADFISQNEEQFPEGTTDAQKKQQAEQEIKNQKQQSATQSLIEELKKKAEILQFVNY